MGEMKVAQSNVNKTSILFYQEDACKVLQKLELPQLQQQIRSNETIKNQKEVV